MSDWSDEELEEVLDALEDVVDEDEALELAADLAYWQDEGFIEIQSDADGVLCVYPKEGPCYLDVPPESP